MPGAYAVHFEKSLRPRGRRQIVVTAECTGSDSRGIRQKCEGDFLACKIFPRELAVRCPCVFFRFGFVVFLLCVFFCEQKRAMDHSVRSSRRGAARGMPHFGNRERFKRFSRSHTPQNGWNRTATN